MLERQTCRNQQPMDTQEYWGKCEAIRAQLFSVSQLNTRSQTSQKLYRGEDRHALALNRGLAEVLILNL